MDEKNKEVMNTDFEEVKTITSDDNLEVTDNPVVLKEENVSEEEKKPLKRKRKKILFEGKLNSLIYISVVLLICVIISAFLISALNDIVAIAKPDIAVEIVIPDGAGTKQISRILKKEGLIKHPFLFEKISKFENHDGKYTPGEHVLNKNMGYTTMMRTLQKPKKRASVTVTIPEGFTLNKIAKRLEENNVCNADDFMKSVNSTDFGFDFEDDIPDGGTVFYKMEGYLFPDTYEFYKNDTPINVIRKMILNFESKISDEMKVEMRNQDLDLHKLLTIASIVQGEAPNVKEMKKVASVYLNRLNSPAYFQRMEADPTREYSVEEVLAHQGTQNIADLYNTYVGTGLPPGPINNPGLDAIKAVLYPEETPYYFFCTNLKTQEFYYAETFAQHNENVRKAGLRGN